MLVHLPRTASPKCLELGLRFEVLGAFERCKACGTELWLLMNGLRLTVRSFWVFDARLKAHGTEFWALLSNLGMRYGRNDQDDDSCSFDSYPKPQMISMRLTTRIFGRLEAYGSKF